MCESFEMMKPEAQNLYISGVKHILIQEAQTAKSLNSARITFKFFVVVELNNLYAHKAKQLLMKRVSKSQF